MIFDTAITHNLRSDEIPKNLIIISDMEFDQATAQYQSYLYGKPKVDNNIETVMEGIRTKWNEHGLRLPNIIYWNVNARQPNIPDLGDKNISYVSGFSPVIFKQIMSGKTGYQLMMEVIDSPEYACIHA